VLCLGTLSFALCLAEPNSSKAFYLLPFRGWEFIAGGVVAFVPTFRMPAFIANLTRLLCLCALTASIFLMEKAAFWPGPWTALPVAATAVLLLVSNAYRFDGFGRQWVIQRVGDLSYSIYLWHWPLLVYSEQLFGKPLDKQQAVRSITLLALTVLLSIFSWKVIEQPIRQNRLRFTSAILSWGAASSIAVFVAFALANASSRGLPERFPAYVQRAYSAAADYVYRQDCFRETDSKKKSLQPFCTVNLLLTGTAPTVLLWGDSHANHYHSAMASALQHQKLQGLLATQASCQPANAGQASELPPAISAACLGFNEEVEALLNKSVDIDTVVLSQLWTGTVAYDNIVKLSKSLAARGMRVLVIAPLPLPGYVVPDHWAKAQLKAGIGIDHIDFWRDPQSREEQFLARLKIDLSSQVLSRKVEIIEPSSTICMRERCDSVRDGKAVYRDLTHLSEFGSLLFTPVFESKLRKIDSI
jgi:SGNH domain (fused to AT3 domains)/Acyltransferase family